MLLPCVVLSELQHDHFEVVMLYVIILACMQKLAARDNTVHVSYLDEGRLLAVDVLKYAVVILEPTKGSLLRHRRWCCRCCSCCRCSSLCAEPT